MKYLEYNEKKTHGSENFTIQYYHVDKSHSQYIMPLHWHREFEIIRIISGSFKLYLDNIEYNLYRGDFALIQCGTLHRGDPENCVYECLVFDLNMLRKRHSDITGTYLLPILDRTATVTVLHHADGDMLGATVNALFGTMRDADNFYELLVYSILYNFIATLYSKGFVSSAAKDRRNCHQAEVITELIDWIEIHYTEQITLLQLAQLSGMNEKYLCRFFREYTGHTPIDYINNFRISVACHEMRINNRTVTETAYECGFNDLSYFSRSFKKYTGQTPREYRDENKKSVSISAQTHEPSADFSQMANT